MANEHAIAGWQLAIARALFDDKYYLRTNPDVRAAGLDGFEHFMSFGAREGRRPSAGIDMREYLELHPHLRTGTEHPLLHYVRHGIVSGGLTRRLPAEATRALEAQSPAKPPPSTLHLKDQLSVDALRSLLGTGLETRPRGLILALSHTNYVGTTGGTENVIGAEAAAFNDSGWCYVHVCPAVPGGNVFAEAAPLGPYLVLTVNGKTHGTTTAFSLARAIQEQRALAGIGAQLVIHHLLGFELESVLALARACGPAPAIVWTHDFYTLCVDPFLMRNDVQFCRSPEPDSSACLACVKGRARAEHLKSMRRLFDELRPRVLAPSAPMLETWTERARLPYADASVVPLARLTSAAAIQGRDTPAHALRVAFLGPPVTVKGWQTFERLLALLQGDERYSFYRFGYGVTGLEGLTEIDVKVTKEDPEAMIAAVAEHEIDVVVNWSACFESFSYVTCEALAAGAFVIARQGAGNVPHLVRSAGPARGTSLRTEAELFALFISGDLAKLAGRRFPRGRVERTSATAMLFMDEAHA